VLIQPQCRHIVLVDFKENGACTKAGKAAQVMKPLDRLPAPLRVVAFVPDAAGKWRVKVIEATGHGLDLEIDAATSALAPAVPSGPRSPVAFVLRPLVGLAAIGAVFAALYLGYRRKKGRP